MSIQELVRQIPKSRAVLSLLIFSTVVAFALVTSGCGSGQRVSTGGSTGDSGEQMPSFTMADLDGNDWSLEDHRGKVVLVNFWATWCPPCRKEIPDLIQIRKDYDESDFELVGISLDDIPTEDVGRFAQQYGINYPILMPGSERLPVGVEAIPTTYILDRDGNIAAHIVGLEPAERLKGIIDEQLAKS